MKKIFGVLLFAVSCLSCNNDKKDEKAALSGIIKIHDMVMEKDERLLKNRTLLKDMSKATSMAAVKDSVNIYLAKIDQADNVMDDWMHKFDPEHKAASHEENMAYLKGEQEKIRQIDSLLTAIISQSDTYLAKHKIK